MKKHLAVLSILLFFGCEDHMELPEKKIPPPFYIKNLLKPDIKTPYDKSYYIHVHFTNKLTAESKEFTFSESNSSMTLRYDCLGAGVDLSEHTVLFINADLMEQLEVSFYYNPATDSTFWLCCADYFYADPWKSLAGANIQYLKPIGHAHPAMKYRYSGIESIDSYFRITSIGRSHVNGEFHTTWKECSGEQTTYDVTGDFSVPDLGYYWRK